MDPALLREGELFKRRALSTPAVEKRPVSLDTGTHKKKQPILDGGSSSGSNLCAGKWGRVPTWGMRCRRSSNRSLYFFRVKSVIFTQAYMQDFTFSLFWTLTPEVTGNMPSLGVLATKLGQPLQYHLECRCSVREAWISAKEWEYNEDVCRL